MINITNYETFFLLYADNELTADERENVLFFVNENPELRDEFESLASLKILPKENIIFKNKQILYAESEEDLEACYSFKPNLNIQYPHKEELYRYEKSIKIGWVKSFTAAASIILIAGLFWMLTPINDQSKKIKTIANKQEISITKGSSGLLKKEKSVNISDEIKSIADKKIAIVHNIVKPKNNKIVEKKMDYAEAVVSSPKRPENSFEIQNIPTEVVDQIMVDPIVVAEPIFVSNLESNDTRIRQDNSLVNTNISPTRKTPFRGIIRKISRIIGKDRPESDQVKFIQVANFQLAIAQ
jgi:hypothetical protein